MMGAFSIYTGLIYNDIFSKSLHLFHSGWEWPGNVPANETVTATPNGRTYPFGLDPGWHGADNALLFTNSYKMKMSIILGIFHVSIFVVEWHVRHLIGDPPQMTFALCLQVPNHIRFKRISDIYTNFIPQMLFLQSIFGYLVVCILYKWSVNWDVSPTPPPSLLNMLIQMFLQPGTIEADSQLYPGQGIVQVGLLLLALVCVPWLLVTKPYLEYQQLKKTQAQGYVGLGAEEPSHQLTDDVLEGEEEGNGRAIAEAMEEEHVSRLLSLFIVFDMHLHRVSGGARLFRGHCAPGYSHY